MADARSAYKMFIHASLERAQVYNQVGKNQQALVDLNRGVNKAQAHADIELQAVCMSTQCEVLRSLSRLDAMKKLAIQTQRLFHTISDPRGEADCLINLGFVYDCTGEYEKALQCYQDALQKIKGIPYPYGRTVVFNNLGRVYDNLGNYRKSLVYYNNAIKLCKKRGDINSWALSLNNIGALQHAAANYNRALQYYRRASTLHQKTGNREDLAIVLNNIGTTLLKQGKYHIALGFFIQSNKIKREIGNIEGIARTLSNIGQLYYVLGDYDKGLKNIRESSQYLKKIKLPIIKFYNDVRIARILIEQNKLSKAANFIKKALVMRKKYRDLEISRQAVLVHGRWNLHMKRVAVAKSCAQAAYATAKANGLLVGQAEALLLKALCSLKKNSQQEAVRQIKRAAMIFKKHNRFFYLGKTYCILSKVESDKKTRLRYKNKAKTVFRKLGLDYWLQKVDTDGIP